MIDFSAPLWMPAKPAIIRAASMEDVERAKRKASFLPGMFPGMRGTPTRRLIGIIGSLGLLTNLRLCLDAGDSASLPASSTKWLDLSGNGYDFFMGATVGAEATDPTINGTPDGLSSSEYLSFDGGDFLTYDTANEAWMNNLHKNGAQYSVMAWVQYASVASAGFMGTNGNSAAKIGMSMGMSGAGKLFASATNGSGVNAMQNISAASIPTGQWAFLSTSVDEAAALHRLGINGTFETFDGTYLSPSASNATEVMQIGARGNNQVPLPNTSRAAGVAMWEGVVLTEIQMSALFEATRSRFGV